MDIGRREFLGIAGASLLVRASVPQTRRRVIVAGAGLSGLSAAYQLSDRGFEVTVIEARSRVGGRIYTLRDPFVDGQYVETGGEILGDGYKRLLKYADTFGIKYEERGSETQTGGSVSNLQRGIGASAFLKGRLYPQGSAPPNPYGLGGDEAFDLPPAFYAKKVAEIAADLRKDPSKLSEYDSVSLAEALRGRGVSARMIGLIDVSLNYNSIETVSMGGILWEGRRRAGTGTKAVKITAGNDQVPNALFEACRRRGVRFLLNSRIRRVSHTSDSARVAFTDGGGRRREIEAERLVCTIPFSVLREVVFDPPMPEPKRKAIDGLAYTKITKVFLQGDRGAWDRQNLGSMVWTDTPCERIFSAAGRTGDRNGIFTVWTDGEGARFPDSLSDRRRIASMKSEFARVLPGMRPERAATKSWGNDEFVRGAYSHFTVGQLTSLQPFIKKPVGAVHFAGEHTAETAPGMEGALESADRVVAEIAG